MLIHEEDGLAYQPGMISKLPVIFTEPHMLEVYQEIRREGWHKDHLGYYIYCQRNSYNQLVLFPAISIITDPPIHSIFETVSVSFEDVENYADHLFGIENEIIRSSDHVNFMVHDLRGISSKIYNSALAAKRSMGDGKYDVARQHMDNVVCAQTILRIRTDILDYLINPASVIGKSPIDLRQKTVDVVGAFRDDAALKKVNFDIDAEGEQVIYCPNVFEFVPFVLIENAIKYCPNNSRIEIGISLLAGGARFSVSSLGPYISKREESTIFLRGVRANAAPKGSGSGVGLYVLNEVVTSYLKGSVAVAQENSGFGSKLSEFFPTTFSVWIPNST